jgi:hypothetical protein
MCLFLFLLARDTSVCVSVCSGLLENLRTVSCSPMYMCLFCFVLPRDVTEETCMHTVDKYIVDIHTHLRRLVHNISVL